VSTTLDFAPRVQRSGRVIAFAVADGDTPAYSVTASTNPTVSIDGGDPVALATPFHWEPPTPRRDQPRRPNKLSWQPDQLDSRDFCSTLDI
jgi:hypothetical protein